MIFQIGIDLNIPDKNVQAVIDLDTGLIGFSEKSDNDIIEFAYQESPPAFKKALIDRLLEKAADKNYLNMKISGKSKLADALTEFWSQQ